jgi:dihydroflavonol-4-reductase
MNVAVTGATGQVGSAVVPLLLQRGYSVKALVRDDVRGLDDFPLERVKGSLEMEESIRRLLAGCDALIHAAAKISITGNQNGLVERTNVDGTRRVLRLAKECGLRRVVYVSSIHAFEQLPADQPLNESRAWVDDSAFAYDRSKRDATRFALSLAGDQLEVLTVHPTSVVGPPDFKPSFLGQAILRYCRGMPFVTAGGFDFVDSRDVATAIVNALTMGQNGGSYLLAGKYYLIKEFFEVLRQISGGRKPIALPLSVASMAVPFERLISFLTKRQPLFTTESLAALRTGNRFIDSSRARSELGFICRPLAETLRDLVEWYRQYGYLAKH